LRAFSFEVFGFEPKVLDTKIMRLFGLYFLFCLVVGVSTWSLVVSSVYRDAIDLVCDTVFSNLYTHPENFLSWRKQCRKLGDEVSAFSARSAFLNQIQDHLNTLHLSHLGVYFPDETKRLWEGKSKDTGIRGRFVEGQFIVFDVLAGSAAEQAGVMIGDSLAAINGKNVTSKFQVQTTKGRFEFLRANELKRFDLVPTEISIDENPKLIELNPQLAVLRISSFRKELFEEAQWLKLTQNLNKYSSIILDLRENPGGNFTAGLRTLSPFFCRPKLVGRIVKPRQVASGNALSKDLPDFMADSEQVEVFTHYPIVNMRTYDSYGCFSGPMVVLIDSQTASVAEVVAEGLKLRDKTRLIGRITSGDVLVGVWYDLSMLGRGYSFSVPEALFKNMDGDSIEGAGVIPDLELDYKLNEAVQGQDSYLLKAEALLL